MPHHVEAHPELLKPQSDTGIPRGQNAALMLTADEQRVIRFEDAVVRDGDVIEGAGSKRGL